MDKKGRLVHSCVAGWIGKWVGGYGWVGRCIRWVDRLGCVYV